MSHKHNRLFNSVTEGVALRDAKRAEIEAKDNMVRGLDGKNSGQLVGGMVKGTRVGLARNIHIANTARLHRELSSIQGQLNQIRGAENRARYLREQSEKAAELKKRNVELQTNEGLERAAQELAQYFA